MATHQILGKDDQVYLAQMLKAAGPLSANLRRLLESLATALAQGSVLQWEAGNFVPTTKDNLSWQATPPVSPHAVPLFTSDPGASRLHENNLPHHAGYRRQYNMDPDQGLCVEERRTEAEGGAGVSEVGEEGQEAQDGDPEAGQAGEAGRSRTKKKCRRGAQPYAPKLDRRRRPQIVGGDTVEAMVAELAAAHPLSESFNPEVWAKGISKGLACQEVPKSASGSGGLSCVISRCFLMTGQDVTINFLLMVNYISLVTQCQRIRLDTGFNLSQIYRDFVQPMGQKISLRMFQKWHSAGSKFAALAGGGTIYVLILIAGLGLRTSIASMTGQGPWELANILRRPDESTSTGRMIIDRVIPAVHAIQRILPLTIESLFPVNILSSHQLLKDGGFVRSSDRFFDWIIFNNFTLLSRTSEWDRGSASEGAGASSSSTTPTVLPCSFMTDRMLERLAPHADDQTEDP